MRTETCTRAAKPGTDDLQRLRPALAGEEDLGHVPGHQRKIRTGRLDPRGIGQNPQVTAALVSFDFATVREAAAGSARRVDGLC